MKTPETSKKATKIKQKTKITPGGNIVVWYLLLELLIWNISIERRKGKERRKERREEEKKERKKGSKNFLKVVNLFPLNIVFSIVCVFPLLTFKLLLKVILHFIPERTNWKQNQKTKTKKIFF